MSFLHPASSVCMEDIYLNSLCHNTEPATSLSIQMIEQEKFSESGSFLQEFSYLLLLLAFTLNKSINNKCTCPRFPFYERSVLVNVMDFIASARTHFWDVKISHYNITNNAIKATLLFKCDNFFNEICFQCWYLTSSSTAKYHFMK